MSFESLKDELLLQVAPVFERLGKVASGRTVESFEVDIFREGDGIRINFTSDPSAEYILQGRQPGIPPPIQPIRDWMEARGLDVIHAYAVKESIGQFGIPPVDWVSELEEEIAPLIQQAFNSGTFDDGFLQKVFTEFGRTDS